MVASPEEGGRWVLRPRGERRRPVAPAGSAASLSPAAWGRGAAGLPPRHLARGVPFREMLLRPSPLLPASRAAAPPGTPPPRPRRALRAAPSPWKFPRRPGTAILPRAPPPRQPGPSLPAPPGEEKNSLSSVNSAARRSLPLRPGLRRQTPGDWWKSRSPSLPHSQNCLLRPVQIRDARLERAPLSRPCSLEIEANNKNTKQKHHYPPKKYINIPQCDRDGLIT